MADVDCSSGAVTLATTGELLERWEAPAPLVAGAGLTDELERNGRFAVVAEHRYEGDIRVELLERQG